MDRFLDGLYIIYIIQTHLEAMASNLVAMAPNLEAMASNLVAMVSNLTAIASNLRAMFVRSSNGSKRTTSRTSRPSVAASRSLGNAARRRTSVRHSVVLHQQSRNKGWIEGAGKVVMSWAPELSPRSNGVIRPQWSDEE